MGKVKPSFQVDFIYMGNLVITSSLVLVKCYYRPWDVKSTSHGYHYIIEQLLSMRVPHYVDYIWKQYSSWKLSNLRRDELK